MSNTVTIKSNGPLVIRGRVKVINSSDKVLAEGDEVYLCRCGASQNPPFCDGSHKTSHFADSTEINDAKTEPLLTDAPLVITVRDNAMLIAKGPMLIQNQSGTSHTTRNKAAFCRCGASANKPFCDSSHKSI